jgi:MFS family permease
LPAVPGIAIIHHPSSIIHGMDAVMNSNLALPAPRIFYGWFVVAAAFAVTFAGFGSAYTFSAFVESLQRDFGASRGSVSLVFSLAGFLYFGLGIVSGPLADRWGSRRLAVAGMLMIGMGLAVASMARSLAEIYAAYGLGVGLGVGCSYVPVLGAVQRWFVKRRGLASGLAVSGIGIGRFWALAVFAFIYGVFYGGWVALLPALVMDYFGGRNVSGLIGILYTSVAFGTLIGPSAAGFAFDLSHSYTLPIVASACANIIAAGIMIAMSRGNTATTGSG